MNKRRNEDMLTDVLDLFLLSDYNVISNTYLDHLLSHIAENTKECKKMRSLNTLLYHIYLLLYIFYDINL